MLTQLPTVLQNLHLPLRLKLWDGHEMDLGPAPSVTIVVKDPQLVADFSHPSLGLLGSAFVEGRLELEGSISEWGGLARFAAREYGVNVFGITLSQQQLALARERILAEGLQDRVDLQLLDYRDLPQDARFDKVVSVGMFEHVGHANLPLYARCLFGAVKEGGLVMNHGITALHTDGRPVGRGAGEFIDRYVFPNGELPHLAMISAHLSDAGLEVVDVESLRPHYAKTLEHWSARLESRLDEAARIVPEQTLRIWRLYLAGCAYGFAKGWINLHQILAVKPFADGSTGLPLTREDVYR
ncbi:class I SAM-dependent methyltransferase [Pseudomonas cannabina]|uniref:Cyclopropane-fatty-acyl-phospholipid synthase n=1 Tax=Pseudomonas cannabina TaxID=86840 RepID=A0A0P9L686_PSECA|nr:class I SAM-dependent methyltransferase [Pseudomonas cannabina]KAA8718213.1 methyltransferase domain-containing protein [Pseudomonas cannabina]KPW65117.1 Cyclopropane-fatty-acyl-phospholipid synthase [Pseudomonas cannabina]RMN36628.1 Cyclopropane-fatty-acyl-phospholipid synthase [Pseudomonas cannabina]SDR41057.1 cyclopropane-fatty-acyl-phospholipid synthase [Pseudomonas cannabina]